LPGERRPSLRGPVGVVRFLSLKWKVTLALSLVLFGVTAGLALLGRRHLEQGDVRESQARRQRQARELNALMQHRYDELQHVAYLSALGHDDSESMSEHLRLTLARYAGSLAPVWPLEAALLYDAAGREQFVWHEEPAALEPLAQAARGVEQPVKALLCLPVCRQYSAVPLLHRGSQAGVLVLGRSLADMLQDYRQVSGGDVALLLPLERQPGPPARPLPSWEMQVSLATNVDRTQRILHAAAAAHALVQLRQSSVRQELDGRCYELNAMPLRVWAREGEASLVFVRDVTEAVQALDRAWSLSLGLGLSGALVVELLLLVLLWGPAGRLRTLARVLPRLARGNSPVPPVCLPAGRRRGLRDELDVLVDSAGELALELERLGGEVARRTTELEEKNTVLLGLVEDLEEQQRQLRSARDQLQQTESVAALCRVAAGMAHEINNALNFTAGALPPLERLLDDLVPRDQGTDAGHVGARRKVDLLLHNMRTGVQRIAGIVRDLGDLARPRQGLRQPLDLAREIEASLALVEPSCQGRITITRRLAPLPPLLCHPGQMGQLLLNLLANAVEAIEGRGGIAVAAWRSPGWIHLRVSDSGGGIPAEQLGRIFDPAFSTKGRGSGLGLAICHGIVRAHGGEIRVSSSSGEGTAFEVILPLIPPSVE